MHECLLTILGGGPAGLGAAYRVAKRNIGPVVLLEARDAWGGNAGSFDLDGLRVDFGSHRLHPASEPRVFQDIQAMLGPDLLQRPRHGRIRLQGRWIHFPLKPLDLATNLPPAFILGVLTDMLRKALPARPHPDETFTTILEQGLGRTICREFYVPYAKKMWGIHADGLAPEQARKRVSAGSFLKLIYKVLGIRSGTSPNKPYFYYPRQGFGQISDAYAHAAQHAGASLLQSAEVTSIEPRPDGYVVEYTRDGLKLRVRSRHLWSTIPLPVLPRLIHPTPPTEILDASRSVRTRAMVLIYAVLPVRQFSEWDAHYFPDAHIPITRMSEPRNYSLAEQPADRTVLCAELPCDLGDTHWTMDTTAAWAVFRTALERSGLTVPAQPLRVELRRLPHAYPIYGRGFAPALNTVADWVHSQGILSFGRQGLFQHDNTHHALTMAYAADECLADNGTFDRNAWQIRRKSFEAHVVED